MKKLTVKEMVLMAFYVALFMVLDYVGNVFNIFQMPNGGSLGISSIALLMASYHLGWKKGLFISVLSVFLQFITGPMYTPDILGFCLDYLLAYGVYGLASAFPNYKYFFSGVLITNAIRLACHTVSGVLIWQTPWGGSLAYNAPYMIATMVLGLIVVPLLYKALEPIIKRTK